MTQCQHTWKDVPELTREQIESGYLVIKRIVETEKEFQNTLGDEWREYEAARNVAHKKEHKKMIEELLSKDTKPEAPVKKVYCPNCFEHKDAVLT